MKTIECQVIQCLVVFGNIVGALTAPRFPKRRGIMVAGMIAIVFSVICMIFNETYAVILACKMIVGVSAGMFNVYCPKFIMETAPKEISGIAGSSFQLLCCLGIWCNAIIGLAFGQAPLRDINPDKNLAKTAFIVFNIPPIVFSALQIVCMMTCFKYDTPI